MKSPTPVSSYGMLGHGDGDCTVQVPSAFTPSFSLLLLRTVMVSPLGFNPVPVLGAPSGPEADSPLSG